MINSVCSAVTHEEAKTHAVEKATSLNSGILTMTRNLKSWSPSSTVKVCYPSLRVTDPRFVYTNAAQTDISRRFKDVTRQVPSRGLQRDDSRHEEAVGVTALDVLEQTLDRLSGRNRQHE
jgi:hypothetical protein